MRYCFHIFFPFIILLRKFRDEVCKNLPELVFMEMIFSCVSEPFAGGLPCGKRVRWSSLGEAPKQLSAARSCRPLRWCQDKFLQGEARFSRLRLILSHLTTSG